MKDQLERIDHLSGGLSTPALSCLLLTGAHTHVLNFGSAWVLQRLPHGNEFSSDGAATNDTCFWHLTPLRLPYGITGRDVCICADVRVHLVSFSLDGERRSAVGWRCQCSISLRKEICCAPLLKSGAFAFYHLRLTFAYIILGCQLLKCEDRCGNHVAKGVEKQVRILAAVESERHLFEVGL